MNIPKYGITHAGVFHADDVFATAFLKKINPDFRWYRPMIRRRRSKL